jgi:hydroxymethylglutaryl-CoA lyase
MHVCRRPQDIAEFLRQAGVLLVSLGIRVEDNADFQGDSPKRRNKEKVYVNRGTPACQTAYPAAPTAVRLLAPPRESRLKCCITRANRTPRETLSEELFRNIPPSVRIVEVGPRDGLQNESVIVPTKVKLAFVERLLAAGLQTLEVTSFVNARWIPALADATELAKSLPKRPDVTYAALVPNMKGYERFAETDLDMPAVFMSASETHNKKNINKTRAETFPVLEAVVKRAKEDGKQVRGYVSTVFGCPYEGRVEPEDVRMVVDTMLGWGIDEISLGDTIGVATPREVAETIDALLTAGVPKEKIALHFHDTRGTALANYLTGLQMGITTLDCSVGSLGGCPYAPGAAGNAATEDLVYLLHGMGVKTGINLEKLAEAGRFIGEALGKRLPGKYQQAYVAACRKPQNEPT